MIETTLEASLPLIGIIFLVAVLYSSVGHGGASGYLAVLSLFAFPASQMSSTALLLNVLVSSLAFVSFWRAGHALPKFSWLLVVFSVPLAFLGGTIHVADLSYKLLLAFALLVAAFRLAMRAPAVQDERLRAPKSITLAGTGGVIGLLSGIVGVGGGIFLSPVAVLAHWTTVKSAATLSAMFIFVNSLAGLAGRVATNRLDIEPALGVFFAAVVGGAVGATIGSRFAAGHTLRRLLALVLFIAAAKLVISAWS